MKDTAKTKDQLIAEMTELRGRVAELEDSLAASSRQVEALRESETRYRFISEHVGDFIWQLDKDLRFTYISPSIRRANFEPEEIIGKPLFSILSPKSGEMIRALYERRLRLIEAGITEDKTMVEVEFVGKDGSIMPVEVRISPSFDEDGNLLCYQGVTRDITQRKATEEALRESEEKFRLLFEKSADPIVLIDGGRIIDCNEAACRLVGADHKDGLVGLTPLDMAPVMQPDGTLSSEKADSLRVRSEDRGVNRFEWMTRSFNGEDLWAEVSQTVIPFNGRQILYTVCRDIRDRKRAEEEKARLESQLRQAQKMEAIGQLAGGIAHDFNNILMVITGFGSILKMNMGQNDPMRKYVDQILSSSEKAASLTRSLLAFSRKQQIKLMPLDVNDIVRNTGQFLERLLSEDIELELKLADGTAMVMADMTQMDQVIINLATNARDAMPRGGLLRIETGIIELDKRFIIDQGFGEPGTYAMLVVSDTGIGMNRTTKEHLFEPFFTTKEAGKGTGLGLSMVYGIVKQHGGYITVDSEEGKGSVFRIYLPLLRTEQKMAAARKERVKKGTETVLIAEDDVAVRMLASEIFLSHGYAAILANDGEDAIRVFRENRDKIDLVMLDVVMPKKNGTEAYEEIRKIDANVRVLFVSGYAGEVIINKGFHDGTVDFISKPLSPQSLLSKVREVLDR